MSEISIVVIVLIALMAIIFFGLFLYYFLKRRFERQLSEGTESQNAETKQDQYSALPIMEKEKLVK